MKYIERSFTRLKINHSLISNKIFHYRKTIWQWRKHEKLVEWWFKIKIWPTVNLFWRTICKFHIKQSQGKHMFNNSLDSNFFQSFHSSAKFIISSPFYEFQFLKDLLLVDRSNLISFFRWMENKHSLKTLQTMEA